MTHPLSKHKGPYRADKVHDRFSGFVFDGGVKDAAGEIVCICHDFELATALADRLNRADALEAALRSAIKIAEEAADEWDKAPSGMRAGKILLALAGHVKGYRADITAIHAALPPTPESET